MTRPQAEERSLDGSPGAVLPGLARGRDGATARARQLPGQHEPVTALLTRPGRPTRRQMTRASIPDRQVGLRLGNPVAPDRTREP